MRAGYRTEGCVKILFSTLPLMLARAALGAAPPSIAPTAGNEQPGWLIPGLLGFLALVTVAEGPVRCSNKTFHDKKPP